MRVQRGRGGEREKEDGSERERSVACLCTKEFALFEAGLELRLGDHAVHLARPRPLSDHLAAAVRRTKTVMTVKRTSEGWSMSRPFP